MLPDFIPGGKNISRPVIDYIPPGKNYNDIINERNETLKLKMANANEAEKMMIMFGQKLVESGAMVEVESVPVNIDKVENETTDAYADQIQNATVTSGERVKNNGRI